MENYKSPSMCLLEIALEGAAMLTQSGYDEKHNTENLTWGEYEEL